MPVFRVLAAVAAALVGSLLLGVPEAGATGPSITVSPSTGLIDGQTVTVSGTGFTVGAPTLLVLDECANVASPDINDCSTGTGVFSPYISEPEDFRPDLRRLAVHHNDEPGLPRLRRPQRVRRRCMARIHRLPTGDSSDQLQQFQHPGAQLQDH